jgi:hypothetical protein
MILTTLYQINVLNKITNIQTNKINIKLAHQSNKYSGIVNNICIFEQEMTYSLGS